MFIMRVMRLCLLFISLVWLEKSLIAFALLVLNVGVAHKKKSFATSSSSARTGAHPGARFTFL
jgi:hypothetical protein